MIDIRTGDCRSLLNALPAGSVQACVTSPPYFGLRDYGIAEQIGLEPTPDEYVAEMVALFGAVRRVLRDDGTLWLNIGDSYSGNPNSGGANRNAGGPAVRVTKLRSKPGRPGNLLGIPWRVAFALQADGWWLRSAIIWHKPNPMPESVKNRPTSAYEMVFLLAKSERYFYDAEAIAEPAAFPDVRHKSSRKGRTNDKGTRNARNVWAITPRPFRGAHFATMPVDLAERCILAGSSAGDTILDPFGGAGTTGLAAQRNARSAILLELNPAYAALARDRIEQDHPAQRRHAA